MIESLVPEHAELTVWLSWFLPLGMLQRNPTLKAEMEDFALDLAYLEKLPRT